jgi:hypothetical protein
MEGTCSSDTSVDFQLTARRNIPIERNINIYIYFNCKVRVYRRDSYLEEDPYVQFEIL